MAKTKNSPVVANKLLNEKCCEKYGCCVLGLFDRIKKEHLEFSRSITTDKFNLRGKFPTEKQFNAIIHWRPECLSEKTAEDQHNLSDESDDEVFETKAK